jgi:hypothetical protein
MAKITGLPTTVTGTTEATSRAHIETRLGTFTLARSQIAAGSQNHVVINDGAGALSSTANIAISQGGTGAITAQTAINNLAQVSPALTRSLLHKATNGNVEWALATDIPISNTSWLKSRNQANSGDVNLIRVNSSNQVELNLPWVTYTASVTTTGTLSLTGHVVNNARYLRTGDGFYLQLESAWNSNTGTGLVRYSLPFTVAGSYNILNCAFDNSSSVNFSIPALQINGFHNQVVYYNTNIVPNASSSFLFIHGFIRI